MYMYYKYRGVASGGAGGELITCPTNNSGDESMCGYTYVTDVHAAAHFSQMLLPRLRSRPALPYQPSYASEILLVLSL